MLSPARAPILASCAVFIGSSSSNSLFSDFWCVKWLDKHNKIYTLCGGRTQRGFIRKKVLLEERENSKNLEDFNTLSLKIDVLFFVENITSLSFLSPRKSRKEEKNRQFLLYVRGGEHSVWGHEHMTHTSISLTINAKREISLLSKV